MSDLLSKIQELHDNNDSDEIIELIEALPKAEQTPEIIGLLARAYINEVEYEKGKELLLSIKDELGHDPFWNYRMGYALDRLNENEEAIKHYEIYLQTNPDDKQVEGSVYSLKKTVERDVLVAELMQLNTDGKYQEMVDIIEAIPEKNRDDEVQSVLGCAYNNLGQYQKAYDILDAIGPGFQDRDKWFFRMGYSKLYLGNFKEAKSYFKGCYDQNDEDVKKLINICEKHLKADKAVANYRKTKGIPIWKASEHKGEEPFDNFDYEAFWGFSFELDAIEEGMVEKVEKELGYKLPASYIKFMNVQNGGLPAQSIIYADVFLEFREKYLEIQHVMPISDKDDGEDQEDSIVAATKFLVDERGFPPIGIAICTTIMLQDMGIFLDYSECGNDGEPKVSHVNKVENYKKTVLAENFEEFIRNLLDEGDFYEVTNMLDPLIFVENENEDDDDEEKEGGISYEEFEAKLKDIVVNYLENSDAKTRHQLVMAWNFDHPKSIMQWIADSKETDKATALMLYWLMAPDYAKGFKDRQHVIDKDDSWYLEDFDIVETLEKNLLSGFYTNHSFAFDPTCDHYGHDHVKGVSKNLVREIPAELMVALAGKKVAEPKGTVDGIPKELQEAYEELADSIEE